MKTGSKPRNKIDYNLEDTGWLMTQPAAGENKKKIIIIAAVALIAVILLGVIGIRSLNEKKYDDQIAIAEKYMQEDNYEQAETAYLDAKKMNPRKPKAREGLAYVYALQGRFEEASDEYLNLYGDTGEEKYSRAAKETGEGRVPHDSEIAIRTSWKEISTEDVPYAESFLYFFAYTAWEGNEGGHYYKEGEMPATDDYLLMFDNIIFGTATTIPADEYSYDLVDGVGEDDEVPADLREYLVEPEFHEDASDPEGWFASGYSVSDQAKVDRYLSIAYNMSDDMISEMGAACEEAQRCYARDGRYYRKAVDDEDAYAESTIPVITSVMTNGVEYCVTYDTGAILSDRIYKSVWDMQIDKNLPYYTYYEMIRLRTVDGKPYWNMTYNGADEPAELAPDEPVGGGEGGSDGSEYQAYADVLRANEAEIKAYWWQKDENGDMYNEINDSYDGAAGDIVNPCVALYDINGDGVQELLFMSSEANYQGKLHIYTYADGEAVECDYGIASYQGGTGPFTDEEVAAGTSFLIAGGEKGTLYIVYGKGDESSTDTICELHMDEGSSLEETVSAEHTVGPDFDSSGSYTGEYEDNVINGKSTDRSGWDQVVNDAAAGYSTLVMQSGYQNLSIYEKAAQDQTIAMSYDDAIAMLTQ